MSQTATVSSDVELDAQSVVELKDIFPADYAGGVEFEVPLYSFLPDQWTRAFLKGLAAFDGFDGKKVLELGVGTGINPAYVLQARCPSVLYATDIDGRCTKVSEKNVKHNVSPERAAKYQPIHGDKNLASWVTEKGFADVVYGCLPQVVKATDMDLHEGNTVGHYYDPALYPSDLHHLGLGLNEYALRQLHPLLHTGGVVILNLSGRPGLGKGLEEMLFRKNGYEPRVLHEEVIQQHVMTSVATLAEVEKRTGHTFEFFTSSTGKPEMQVSASVAEQRRLAGQPVYHKIYVIAGVKK
jgi:SAM-dependent methyltransferase